MAKVEPKKFVVRISPELHGQVVQLGKENHRSLNNQVAVILDSWFDAQALRERVTELERTVTD